MTKKKTVLVTGGAGFIGSHVNLMLHQAGYDTVIFDNLSRGLRESVICGTFVEGDLADPKALDALFSKYPIDAVMHFAAFIDVGESVNHPMLYYRNNVVNTWNLLDAMLKHHVHYFIFSSSASIFGMPLEERISEKHPKSPINPYGEGKWMVEKVAADLTLSHPLRFCALRYFNAAGGDPQGRVPIKKQHHTNLIPRLLCSIRESRPITIYGTDYPTFDGTCIRDYIDVNDLAAAHILAMEKLWDGDSNKLYYNLGNGQGFSVRQVIEAAEKVTGKRVTVVKGERRPGDPPVLIADASHALRELGWRPKTTGLEDIVGNAWRAH
jgi:UDP-glucose 4-epimerase